MHEQAGYLRLAHFAEQAIRLETADRVGNSLEVRF
jgi:hypothetical protein